MRYLITACNTLSFRGFFPILCAVLCSPFANCKKEFNTFWSWNKRRKVTLSNQFLYLHVTWNNSIPFRISLKTEEKFWKCNNEVNLSESELRLQCCRRNLRIARKAVQVAIPLGELKSKLKNGGSIKKNFTICDPLYSPRPVQPYHFQPNLIWCDGTFKLCYIKQLILADRQNWKPPRTVPFWWSPREVWACTPWRPRWMRSGGCRAPAAAPGSLLPCPPLCLPQWPSVRRQKPTTVS